MTRAPRIPSRVTQEFRDHYKIYLTWLVWFAAFVLLVRATLGGPDGSRYMAYIRSLVFDHDLLLMNELEHYGQRVIITATGYSAQIANVGVIPFWLPFYLMGLLSAWLNGDVGSGLASNYALWLDFGDWLYGLLAMVVMYKWARTRSSRNVALTATLLICSGTSFIYYVTALAPSYHAISALLSALFFYMWDTTRNQRTKTQWFGLGLLVGSLMSMAQYHAVLLVFLIFDSVAAPLWGSGLLISDLTIKNLKLKIRNSLAIFIILASALILPLVPQFIAWWIIFGNPFANPYTLEANWGGTSLPDVLFSSYHGLYFTAPILILATLGWLLAFKRDKLLYLGALIALLGIAYSSSTRIGWWAGVSFGGRYFIALTPLFVLGFATICEIANRKLQMPKGRVSVAIRYLPLAIGFLCVLWTYGYFLQAFTSLTSFSEYHSAQQWIGNQLIVARHLGEMLAAHWLTPRSPTLMANLASFALYSLIITRLAARWFLAGRMTRTNGWIIALALVPLGFSVFLLTTVVPGADHKQQLAASGYYAKNLARSQFDFEQFSYEYVERARYDEAIGQMDAARADMQRAIALWPVKSRQLVTANEISSYHPLSLKFGNQVELVGYQLQATEDNRPGVTHIPCQLSSTLCPLTIRLLWRALNRLPEDYDVGVLLFDTNGQVVTRTPPTDGLDPFPATWWLAGAFMADAQILADVQKIPVPSLLKMRVEVFDAHANKRLPIVDSAGNITNGFLGEVKRASVELAPSGVPIASLGGKVSLLSYKFTREANGASLLLLWRAESSIDKDYTVFVHLLDAQDRFIAQSDAQPVAGRYPTHAWEKGEVVSDTHQFTLTADALGKVDHIVIGMYTLSDSVRLPNDAGGDAIIIRGTSP